MKKRALISVYDKDKILEMVNFLINHNYEIISTGGTYKYLKDNKVSVIEISEITNFPEMLDGRVKTLHPNIYAGILAIRNNKNHMSTITQHNIQTIDLVIVNLYPFFEKVKENLSFDQKVEFIDIGGPTMLRAAAKNFHDVTVICDKHDYQKVTEEIKAKSKVSLETNKYFAGKVFNLTSAYDGAISQFLLQEQFPNYLATSYSFKQSLRYGENPHQDGCFYSDNMTEGALNTFDTLNGKELSYNNFKDVDVAWKVVCEFEQPACCAIKHNTPCGVAIGKDGFDAYKKAYEVDPMSIFGGIISFNRKLDKQTALELNKIFLEVIIAPDYDKEALEVLKTKKNLRVLKFYNKPKNKYTLSSVDGGLLVQSEDNKFSTDLTVVTKNKPTSKQMDDLIFAMKVVKHVKSNAVVVANNGVALGIGGGQTNRVWPTRDALSRGKGATVLASDAFFPFRDVVDEIAKYKDIKAIIQPGGSIKDQDSIQACDEHNISMVFTKMRHFKH